MAPSCMQGTPQAQSTSVTLQKSHSDEQQAEMNTDEHLAEDAEKEEEDDDDDDEDGEYCYDNETLEVQVGNGAGSGAIAQLEQCTDVQLGARLHYHAPVVINQHFGSEHQETHIPPSTKSEENGKDIYDLFAPNKDKTHCSKMRSWAYIGALFLANVAVTCIVASVIVASNNPESGNSDLEQRTRFNQFLEFIQSHTSGKTKWAALPTVVRANEVKLARWMLQQGANTEAMDEDGWTAAHRAAEMGSVQMLQLLAEYGANMRAQNTFGDTTLHIAFAEGRVDVVEWLLNDGGVPADILSRLGATPLYNGVLYYFRSQVSKVFSEVLQLLLSKGADLSRISFGTETALHLAAAKGHVQAVKDLLNVGADVNVLDINGQTPLHRAASAGNLETATILVERGASPNAQDKNGKTPVDLAKDNVADWFKTLGILKSTTSATVGTIQYLNEQKR